MDKVVARIKQAVSCEEVLASFGHQPKRRTAMHLWYLCPLHEEKTPSFTVSTNKDLYYCFGCGKGGDVVSLVQELEGLDFKAAVEWLARFAGLVVEWPVASKPREVPQHDQDWMNKLAEHLRKLVKETPELRRQLRQERLRQRGRRWLAH